MIHSRIVTTYTYDLPGSTLHGMTVRTITPADQPPQLPASARDVLVSVLIADHSVPEHRCSCCGGLFGTQNDVMVCRACGAPAQ